MTILKLAKLNIVAIIHVFTSVGVLYVCEIKNNLPIVKILV